MIAGIDEAGRGAVLGPLVVAGISVQKEKHNLLKKLGVRDSKQLTPERREKLSEKIEEIAKDVIVLEIGACKIDNYRKMGLNLNKLETMKFAEIINLLKPLKVYVDGCEIRTDKMKKMIEKMLIDDSIEVVVENFADRKYPVVSAASIIAKVTRDKKIEELKEKYGDFGSGYPSDPITIDWLKNWLEVEKDLPSIARKTWVTSELIKSEVQQSKLTSFFRKLGFG